MEENFTMENSSKKWKLIAFGTLGALIIGGVVFATPIIKKDLEIKSLRKQIEQTEQLIQMNKDEWARCEQVMENAHNVNENLREQQKELKAEYNELVGFTMASEQE